MGRLFLAFSWWVGVIALMFVEAWVLLGEHDWPMWVFPPLFILGVALFVGSCFFGVILTQIAIKPYDE